MLKSGLCNYGDAHILVNKTIIIVLAEADLATRQEE